jgi:signal transduction histidine kinase
VPTTAVVTFLVAAFLGWVITRRIVALRLEERIGERTRIARELHDTLLQGVISISMQLHVAIDQLPEGSQAGPLFDRVLRLTGQVIDEGRNTVRGFRSIDRKSEDLEGAFSRVPQDLDVKEEIDFRVVVEGRPRPLHPVIRDEVYSIGREALVNAFRHSGAAKIKVELEYSARCLRIIVRDDGCGINTHVQQAGREGHWGLSGMRERAQKIGAKLKVFSRIGAGTEVELRVPGSIAFEYHSSLPSRWFAGLYRRLAATTLPAHNRRVG